jgi:hypothetical protein
MEDFHWHVQRGTRLVVLKELGMREVNLGDQKEKTPLEEAAFF